MPEFDFSDAVNPFAPKKSEFDFSDAVNPFAKEVNPAGTFAQVASPDWQDPRGQGIDPEMAPAESKNPDWHKDFRPSVAAEMGGQVKAGAVADLPRMVGNAIKAYDSIESAVLAAQKNAAFAESLSPLAKMARYMQPYDVQQLVAADAPVQSQAEFDKNKQGINDAASQLIAEADKAGQFMNPNMDGRGPVAQAFIHGARSLAPSVATLAAGPTLAPVAAAALFGGDQYTQTRDKLLAAGKSEEEANRAAIATGVINGGGEAITDKLSLGMLGAGRGVATQGMNAMLGRATDSAVIKPWAKAAGAAMVGEPLTEIAQDAGTEAVERGAGLTPGQNYGDIAKQSGGAALAMTAMLAPLGLAGHYRNAQQASAINQILSSPDAAPIEQRQAVVDMLHQDARDANVPGADEWHAIASEDVANGRPVYRGDVGSAQEQDYLAQNEQPAEQAPQALGHNPDRMISMPDGTTAWESELARIQPPSAAQNHPGAASVFNRTPTELEAELGDGRSVDEQIAELEDGLRSIPYTRTPIQNWGKQQQTGPVGNEIDYAPPEINQPSNIQLAQDYQSDPNAIDYTPQKPSRVDELASGVNRAINQHIDNVRNARLPEGLKDPRLLREQYRGMLEGLANNLTKGGGVSYLRDDNGNITGRTGSINPEWFKSMNASGDESMSVDDVHKSVKKALAGEKLGVRQARVVAKMLDEAQGIRTDYAQVQKEQRQAAILDRKKSASEFWDSKPDSGNDPYDMRAEWAGISFNENDYTPDSSYDERSVSELAHQALDMGASWEDVDGAIAHGDPEKTTSALGHLIYGLRNEHRATRPDATRAAQADVRPGNSAGTAADMAAEPADSSRPVEGEQSATEQAPGEIAQTPDYFSGTEIVNPGSDLDRRGNDWAAKIQDMTDGEVNALHAAAGLRGKSDKRKSLLQQHPDDLDIALQSISKMERPTQPQAGSEMEQTGDQGTISHSGTAIDKLQKRLNALIAKRDKWNMAHMDKYRSGSATRAKTTTFNARISDLNEQIQELRDDIKLLAAAGDPPGASKTATAIPQPSAGVLVSAPDDSSHASPDQHMPSRVYVGAGSFRPKPIGKKLYRETNLQGISDLLRETLGNTEERGSLNSVFVADHPDFALGQGDNKGVKVVLDGKAVSGDAHLKPGSEFVGASEYKTNYIGDKGIASFTIPKGQSLKGAAKVFADRHFDKTVNQNGDLQYVRKGVNPAENLWPNQENWRGSLLKARSHAKRLGIPNVASYKTIDEIAPVIASKERAASDEQAAPTQDKNVSNSENDRPNGRKSPESVVVASEEKAASMAESLKDMSDSDFDSLLDDIFAESPETTIDTAKPRAKRPKKTGDGKKLRKTATKPEATNTDDSEAVKRTAGEIAKRMGGNLGSAAVNALEGLTKLFGGANNLNSGLTFDEQTYAKAKPHFEAVWRYSSSAGKDLADFVRAIRDNFGAGIKPYLSKFAKEKREELLSAANTDNERNSGNRVSGVQAVERNIQPEKTGERRRGAGQPDGQPGNQRFDFGDSIPGVRPATNGERGGRGSEAQQSSVGARATGVIDDRGSPDDGAARLYAERAPDGAIESAAEQAAAVGETSLKPATGEIKRASASQIKARMPFLTDGQVEDVVFAEKRLTQNEGFGVMFTNGTGTGKTFTGLGIVRRMLDAGKKNVLIVAPKQTILDGWKKAASGFFGINATILADTKSNGGGGVVGTTYAALSANNALSEISWDAIVLDESHYLSSDEAGNKTEAQKNFDALAGSNASRLASMLRPDLYEASADLRSKISSYNKSDNEQAWAEAAKLEDKLDALIKEIGAHERSVAAAVKSIKPADKPRAVFLSATPFAYDKNIQYANGYLFDWGDDKDGLRYNSGGNREQFFMQHFGYSMRYNRLTTPDAKVDSGLMERNFNAMLKAHGVLSGRALDSDFDYDRRFVLSESQIGKRVDDAIKWLNEAASGKSAIAGGDALRDEILKDKFDYHARMYFLEAIKAREAMPYIDSQLEAGRNVLVMHDFKKGGTLNPFSQHINNPDSALQSAYAAFKREFKDLIGAFEQLPSPIDLLSYRYPGALIYNGDVSAKERIKLQDKFNDDGQPPMVMIAQGDAMREGVSIHDTTGKRQRVLVHLGMPVKPTAAIQQEGRIYRTGQKSNALFRYFTIGTAWERMAFASKIAGRAGTAENLAMGEEARGLKQSFIDAYEDAQDWPVGYDGEGVGGKAEDRARAQNLTRWDQAKSYYFGSKKQGKGRSSSGREGNDYFATPEPVGLKMVEWSGAKPGDRVLEPSAGHGAISRWFPEGSKVRAIEQSAELASRLMLHTDGDVINGNFEDHHIVNKYGAVVMNPPYGSGGKTAIDHLAKAAQHLTEGGRVVALIPTGPAADKKFENWLFGKDSKGKNLEPDLHLVMEVALPRSTFERAGTSVSTRIVVIEKVALDSEYLSKIRLTKKISLNDDMDINELFDSIEHVSAPDKATPEERKAEALPAKSVGKSTEVGEVSGNKIVTDAPEVEYTTKKGKLLKGVLLDMPIDKAKEIDKYSWVTTINGVKGAFVRMEYVARPAESDAYARKINSGSAKRGVAESDVRSVFNDFINRFKGAGDVQLRILRDSTEFPGYDSELDKGSILQASYSTRNKVLRINRSAFDSKEDLTRALREELLVHKGLGFFSPEGRREIYARIDQAVSEDKTGKLTAIWKQTEINYKPQADGLNLNQEERNNLYAEEFLGKIAQEKAGKIHGVFLGLYLKIKRALVKIGLIKNTVTIRELKNVINNIAGHFEDGRAAPPRNWIADVKGTSSAQDSRVDSPELYSRQSSADSQTRPSGGFSVFGVFKTAKQKQLEEETRALDPNIREAFSRLGDKDKTILQKIKTEINRQLTPAGLLPNDVFDLKIERDGKINSDEFLTQARLRGLYDAVKADFGRPYEELQPATKALIDRGLKGEAVALPDGVKKQLELMRNQVKNLSRAHLKQLLDDVERLKYEGKDAEAESKLNLAETIAGNMDTYLHRSYRAFDDKEWPKKAPPKVFDAAVKYLAQGYADGGRVTAEHIEAARKKATLMLEEGTAFDTMGAFISESKLGAKDLSIIKKRKDIAPEIRALLGEYEDPAINYAKTVTKMARLVYNGAFLSRVREIGFEQGFLHNAESLDLNANKQIAGDASEVYAPLNGLYTTKEFHQAMIDAMGRENSMWWYQKLIQANGVVKFGKTILSPTTALRNLYSAMFFSMANGHFDFSQGKKFSFASYFKHHGGAVGYMAHLRKIGVIYDSPYASEMMDLLKDSRLEDTIFATKPMRWTKSALDFAQKFYSFGDDLWKIIGFENEKAMLIKHAGMSDAAAEKEAAERIRNTYPTYSLTPRAVNALRRFPLVGTFVSFPAETIRTSYHITRYLAHDIKTQGLGSPMVMRKLAGYAIAAGAMWGLQALTKALLGVTDDEEDALRLLSPEWQKNSNLAFLGRDYSGALATMDLSFLDPYNYWKRPIIALTQGQPIGQALTSAAHDLLAPFFGQDIAFGAIMDAAMNKKDTGGRVFNPEDSPMNQTADIAGHIAKAVQPGIMSNLTRMYFAAQGKVTATGKKFEVRDELAALAGFRWGTFEPKTALYYQSFGFIDQKRDAASVLTAAMRDPNKVSDDELKGAFDRSMKARKDAYSDIIKVASAAKKSGLSVLQVQTTLRNSGISQADAFKIARGDVPEWHYSSAATKAAIKKAKVLFDQETADEFKRREKFIKEGARK